MTVSPLSLVLLEVEDLDRALGFYNDLLGLGLKRNLNPGDDRWTSGEHAELSWTDGRYLHFAIYRTKGAVTRNLQLGFMADDLDGLHARMVAAGVRVEHGPRPEPWGRTARYYDPDGNSVSLTEQR